VAPRPAPPEPVLPPLVERPSPRREASSFAVAARVVVMVASVMAVACLVFIAVQERRQTSLLRRQGCLQQTSYIRALEPSTESAQQLLVKQTAEVRACVGQKP
jgi:hypothetical protein